MISVAELVYAAGIAAAVTAKRQPSGTYTPDVVYCNVGRKHAGVNIYHEFEIVADLAGGLPATLPLEGDFYHEQIGPQIAGLHGGGSPVMETIAILGTYDLKAKKDIAKQLAGIPIE